MVVNNNELVQKITEWENELGGDDKHIHFALLEVFIEFEKFLTKSFIDYALKVKGSNGFSPELRIEFEDKKHLEGFLKCDKNYIDYIKKIKEIKEFIFKEETCPFNKVFSTSKFNTYFNQMKILRDFIAHQSEESKKKYQDKILGSGSYIKVNTYLKKINKKENISNYSIYVNAMRFYSEIICNMEE